MPDLLSPDMLKELIDYDPESGTLVWRPRSANLFRGTEQSPEHSAKIWNAWNAGKPALASMNRNGYGHGAIFGQTYMAHRVAWAIHFGEWPRNDIDHINGDRTDNRITNLRDVPCSENAKNMKRNRRNTSGVTGVSWFPRTGKWVAMIKGDGKVRNLGYFHTLEEAAAARKAAERKYGFHPNHGRAAP